MKISIVKAFWPIILVALLVGCGEKLTPRPTFGPTPRPSTATPFSTQELIETVKPTISKAALSTPSSISTAFSATPSKINASPTPFLSPTPIPAALPFHDCARTPGIVGCDPSAPGLSGHMAFYDAESNRLIGLDLITGQGWEVPIPRPKALEWSPDGSQLLVRMNFPKDEPYEYLLFEKEGKLIRQFSQDKHLYWQPQGAELRTYDERKIVRSRDGAEAWLEGKTLHFRKSGTADWKTAVLEIKPMEWHTELYGWIPGTSNILIEQLSGISTVSWVMTGHNLYIFNIETERLGYMKDFHTHPDPQFMTFRGSDLAIIQLNMGLADDTLAILDGKTGTISHPVPRMAGEVQPFSFRQIAWQPEGSASEAWLAMMVNLTRTNLPELQPTPSPVFSKDGIYLYNQASGQTEILREMPQDVLGGNFYWTDDGQYLLYSLGPVKALEDPRTSLFVRQVRTGKEWRVLDHLVNPDLWNSYISWNLIAVFTE